MSFLDFFSNDSVLKVGDPAPCPISQDENGDPLYFAATYARGTTLVYFYPTASTPGCTKQACGLRDSFAPLLQRGLQIIGVSGDRPAGQHKFKEHYRLPFPLAADHDGVVAKAFGVPTVFGIARRQSFLIHDGKIAWIKPHVAPGKHVADVEVALDSIN